MLHGVCFTFPDGTQVNIKRVYTSIADALTDMVHVLITILDLNINLLGKLYSLRFHNLMSKKH